MTDAYPLAWPQGWPRTALVEDARYRFKRPGGPYGREPWTFAAARDALYEEIRKLGAGNVVISSNFQTGRYGEPLEGRRRPDDQAIAVYFTREGKQLVMACDRFLRAEENMRSLALALDAIRQLERHGGGVMMEKAFAGFTAIEPPRSPWGVLGVKPNATREEVEAAYRAKAKAAHPDAGGSTAAMAELNQAREDALRA